MLVIPGGSALSAHQAATVLDEIQSGLPDCCGVSARFLHFVEVKGELPAARLATLERLLWDGGVRSKQSGDASSSDGDPPAATFIRVVTPRVGTISPWSTKATDILHHCGLGAVERVERGVEWRIHFRHKSSSFVG